MDLEGASAIVTGGASGLGEATMRAFVARGVLVTIADINDERAKGIVDELGGKAEFLHTDVTSEDDVQAAVDAASARGPLRVLVNCAGSGVASRIVKRDGSPHDLASFVWTVNLCLVGTFNCIRLAAVAMAKTDEVDDDGQRGVIVNTASIAAIDGQIGQAAYSAAKGGVIGMTLPIARDVATHGIRVMTIAPGTFLTPAMEKIPEAGRQVFADLQPFPHRFGHAGEYASLVEQIIDNPMLNGEVIRLDAAVRFPPR